MLHIYLLCLYGYPFSAMHYRGAHTPHCTEYTERSQLTLAQQKESPLKYRQVLTHTASILNVRLVV